MPLPLITLFIMLFCVAKFLESASSVADFSSSLPRLLQPSHLRLWSHHSVSIASVKLFNDSMAISCHHCGPPLGSSLLWFLWSLFILDFLHAQVSPFGLDLYLLQKSRSSPYLAVSLPLPLVFLLFFPLSGFPFISQTTIHSKKFILYSVQWITIL